MEGRPMSEYLSARYFFLPFFTLFRALGSQQGSLCEDLSESSGRNTHTHKDPYKIFLFKTLFNDLLTRAPQEPAGSLKENSCKDLWKMICLQKDLLKDLRIRKL